MNKIWQIGWKDLIVLFRDRGALILMLGAPFVLTLGLGLVTGSFSGGSSSGLAGIPVVIVNQDSGQLGQALVDVFSAPDLAELVAAETAVSPTAARQLVDEDEIAAAVIIPAGFTASILPDGSGQMGTVAAIEVYTNPARPISAGVVRSIVQSFVQQVETGMVSVNVAMAQLVQNGRVTPTDTDALVTLGQAMGQRLINDDTTAPVIRIARDEAAAAAAAANPNFLAYIAPGMAVAFLMYTVALGGRSILTERDKGTLARLLVSPTSTIQVMAGKVIGIFLTGVAQVSVLIAASSLLFGLRWGSLPGVILLIVTVSAAATGWGLLLASVASRPSQVSSMGTALMLVFGILGGSFIQIPFTGFLAQLSKITPNAWAIEGFTSLSQGASLSDILPILAALMVMAVVLFGTAVFIFQRRAGALVAR
ncbi:MAG: ABC transporter permease [Ardenticatenaceae bacterium]|nr:ABC transporter permease [Ardenticatenaceae bacterium]